VDALIVDSVQAHLENSSFNNTGDVAGLVQSIGVDVARVNGWFPELQELMERRHHVVHQSDRNEPLRRGHHRTRALSNGQVSRWLLVVVAFAGAVTSELEGEAPRPGAQ
jgi:hypothetical protein